MASVEKQATNFQKGRASQEKEEEEGKWKDSFQVC